MRFNNIKALIKLANYLDDKGLYKKADVVDNFLKKALPMLAVVGPGNLVGEYDESNPAGYSTSEWYDAVQEVGTDFILIHADYGKILNDQELLDKFNELFLKPEQPPPSGSLLDNAKAERSFSFIYGEFPQCDAKEFIDSLNLTDKITIPKDKKIEDIAFILWDKQDVIKPSRDNLTTGESLVKRDPFYLRHDLFHAKEDPDDYFQNRGRVQRRYKRLSTEGEIGLNLFRVIYKMKDCYKAAPGTYGQLSDLELCIALFGKENIRSSSRDFGNDILSLPMAGKKLFDTYKKKNPFGPPEEINIEGKKFILDNSSPNCTFNELETALQNADRIIWGDITGEDNEEYLRFINEYSINNKRDLESGRVPDLRLARSFNAMKGLVTILP